MSLRFGRKFGNRVSDGLMNAITDYITNKKIGNTISDYTSKRIGNRISDSMNEKFGNSIPDEIMNKRPGKRFPD